MSAPSTRAGGFNGGTPVAARDLRDVRGPSTDGQFGHLSGSPVVLLVDADPEAARTVQAQLGHRGIRTVVVPDAAEALMAIGVHPPDLVLLGPAEPVISGPSFLRVLRRRHQVPVIGGIGSDGGSGRSGGSDPAALLAAGATACVSWPFKVEDLLHLLPVHLGRALPPAADEVGGRGQQTVTAGDITVDLAGHDVHVAGERVRLPRREFELLVLLTRNAERVVAKDEILQTLWGPRGAGGSNSLAVHIRRLRQHLGDDVTTPRRIITLRGIGYRLDPVALCP